MLLGGCSANCMKFILTARAHFFPVPAHARKDLSILLHLFTFALDRPASLGQSCRAARLPVQDLQVGAECGVETKLRHTLDVEVFASAWKNILAKCA